MCRGRRKGRGRPASPSCLSHSGWTLICFCHSIFCCNCENQTKTKRPRLNLTSTCDVTAPLMSVCVKSRHSDIWVLTFPLPVAHAAGLKKSSNVLAAMNGSQEPRRSRYGIQKRTCAPKPSKLALIPQTKQRSAKHVCCTLPCLLCPCVCVCVSV